MPVPIIPDPEHEPVWKSYAIKCDYFSPTHKVKRFMKGVERRHDFSLFSFDFLYIARTLPVLAP
jgi:hypothetical protein